MLRDNCAIRRIVLFPCWNTDLSRFPVYPLNAMQALSAFILLILSLQWRVLAHDTSRRSAHRRARKISAETDGTKATNKRQACTIGAWRCEGSILQRCYSDQWNTVQTCTAPTLICSASDPLSAPGCVWANMESPIPASTSLPAIQQNNYLASGVSSTQVSLTSVPSSSTVSAPSPSASGTGSTGSIGPGEIPLKAPYRVAYSNTYTVPSPSDLGDWNVLILAFWSITAKGPGDSVIPAAWASLSATDRKSQKDAYHAAGSAVMISVFGATDITVVAGNDPTTAAQDIATFVKNNDLDGVDVDFEDFAAVTAGTAEAWLETLTKELRKQLPRPYIISHAPLAPWFTDDSNLYPKGMYHYLSSAASVGNEIDFYNIQFYSQKTAYTDCKSLVTDSSGTQWKHTSLLEIHTASSVPYDKLVMGKLMGSDETTQSGYSEASDLAPCYAQGKTAGWTGGVMIWRWSHDPGTSVAWLKTVTGS